MSDLKAELASLRIDRDRPAPRRWPWWLLATVIVVIAGGVLAWRARQVFAVAEVETARATVSGPNDAAPGTAVLTASGYVVPRRKAVVSAKIQGRLAELRVEEGSRIRQGAILARLESADYAAQVQRARAQIQRAVAQRQRAEADLAEYRRQLQVAENLTRERLLPEDQLEAARSRVRIAEAALDQARAEVEQARAELALSEALFQNTLITAPFTGTVVKKMAEVGESVAPIPPGVNISTASGAIVALADLDTLEVEADVNESNVARLTADQPAEVTVEAFPNRRYRGVLRQVIPTADRTKATVQVKVTILDKDKDLKPEMSARVNFVEPEEQRRGEAAPGIQAPPVVTVPQEAVVARDGVMHVFEVIDGTARARRVVPGPSRDGRIVIKEGLAGSETVIVRPAETLKDGDPVKIVRPSTS